MPWKRQKRRIFSKAVLRYKKYTGIHRNIRRILAQIRAYFPEYTPYIRANTRVFFEKYAVYSHEWPVQAILYLVFPCEGQAAFGRYTEMAFIYSNVGTASQDVRSPGPADSRCSGQSNGLEHQECIRGDQGVRVYR
jgi:hypothetical protein